jgi:hypothetical protein
MLDHTRQCSSEITGIALTQRVVWASCACTQSACRCRRQQALSSDQRSLMALLAAMIHLTMMGHMVSTTDDKAS